MSYQDDFRKEVRERFQESIANHTVTELKRDGLYGHWRCMTQGTWVNGFDIVTWPGSLCYTGDMGDYLFQRVDNMITFMQRNCRDADYSAEKCVASDGRIREYRKEVFREYLDQLVADKADQLLADAGDGESDMAADEMTDFESKVELAWMEGCDDEYAAHTALRDDDDLWPDEPPDLKAYTFHFLWALEAIKWFCDRLQFQPVKAE